VSDQSNDPFQMMRKDSHPPVVKRVEYGVPQGFCAKMTLHHRMDQDIYRATDAQSRKAVGADASGLSFVDENSARLFHGIGNGCRFAVIECGGCWADDELLKILRGRISKANDFHEAGSREFMQAVQIFPSAPPPCLKLS
jgi:hypothetical protein